MATIFIALLVLPLVAVLFDLFVTRRDTGTATGSPEAKPAAKTARRAKITV